MQENSEQQRRITRMDMLKWLLFVLLAGRLLKLEIEARPPPHVNESQNLQTTVRGVGGWCDSPE